MTKGTLFIISGPSGVGKGTLVALLLQRLENIGLSISATTRLPRLGEREGTSYYFLSNEQFDKALDEGRFAEWAHVHEHRYGTLVSEIDRNLNAGKDLILEIDVQGGLQIKEQYPDAVTIFVDTPSQEELERRLRGRGTESASSIERRLHNAALELPFKERYNVVITNDDLENAVDQLVDIVEHYRLPRDET